MRIDHAKSALDSLLFANKTAGAGVPPAVMLWGPPGIGKSAICRQLAEEHHSGFRDVRLVLLNPVDLRGLPVPNREAGRADWLPAGFLPDEERDGKCGILVLDEINACPPSVQAAAYQLVLDRQVGDYRLPQGWRILAAGNRAQDRSVSYRMPAALANRMIHLNIEPELQAWKRWALPQGVDPVLVAFLDFRPELLYVLPANPDEPAFPSPRSWTLLSQVLSAGRGGECGPWFSELVAGVVGPGAALEFEAFRRLAEEIPDADGIVAGVVTEVPPNRRPDLIYALTGAIVDRVRRLAGDEFSAGADNALKYLSRLPAEFSVYAVRSLALAIPENDPRRKTLFRLKGMTEKFVSALGEVLAG